MTRCRCDFTICNPSKLVSAAAIVSGALLVSGGLLAVIAAMLVSGVKLSVWNYFPIMLASYPFIYLQQNFKSKRRGDGE